LIALRVVASRETDADEGIEGETVLVTVLVMVGVADELCFARSTTCAKFLGRNAGRIDFGAANAMGSTSLT
jgi:hypothetical protein